MNGKETEDARKPTSPPTADSWKVVSVRAKSVSALESDPNQEIAPHAMYRQQLLSTFLRQLLPKTDSEFAGERSWLALVPEISMPTKALEVSTTALCMVSIGRRNEDLVLVQQSLSLYVQALREIQIALWDPHSMHKDDTLGACMALAMYELLGCPDASRRAYVSHQDGMAKLVELRGPEAYTSGFGHQIFLGFRKQNVCHLLFAPRF